MMGAKSSICIRLLLVFSTGFLAGCAGRAPANRPTPPEASNAVAPSRPDSTAPASTRETPAQAGTGKAAPAPPAPPSTVGYVEQREHGDRRLLGTDGTGFYGVDINSRMLIRVDAPALRRILGGGAGPSAGEAAALEARIDSLSAAAVSLDEAAKLGRSLVATYARLDPAVEDAAFRSQQQHWATIVVAAKSALRSALAARLVRNGRTPAEATDSVRSTMNALLGPGGRDWAAFADRLSAEIARTQAEVQALPGGPGVELAIRAFRTDAAGHTVAIPLDRYNSEQPGAASQFQKVQLAVSPEQQAVYAHLDSLAAALRATHDSSNVIVQALYAEYLQNRSQLEGLFRDADLAVKAEVPRVQALRKWTVADTLTKWLDVVRQRVGESPAFASVRTALSRAGTELEPVATQLTALQGLASLRGQLLGKDPVAAMSLLLGEAQAFSGGQGMDLITAFSDSAWKARAASLQDVLTAARAAGNDAVRTQLRAPDGPLAALDSAVAGLRAAADAVRSADKATLAWLRGAIVGAPPAVAASQLPVPAGQKRLPLAGDLGTAIDLTTIPGGRSINDRVDVYYDFYRGGDPSNEGWHDAFRVRSYGWSARVVAGLAFVNRQGETVWKPTPSLSWIAWYNDWPGKEDRDPGLGRSILSYVGAGLSTMSLTFDPQQAVQVGIGPTVSALDNRLLGGYGLNLQTAGRKGFWFFSIRLLSANGGLGGN